MILALFLCSSPAFAGDEPPPSTDGDTTGIVQIPEGTVITRPGTKPFTVEDFSYLMPEPMYDRALTKAKQLDICTATLASTSDQVTRWIGISEKALTACEGQFVTDQTTIDQLTAQVKDLEVRALTAEDRLRDVKTQRNTAWAITGGLILGAVAVTAVAVGI